MRILFIGGTRFVGLHMARQAIERGHEVTVFHRSEREIAGLESAQHVYGDRDSDLSGLAMGEWDVVIDACAYRPAQIDVLARALEGRVGRFVFISTISVHDAEIPGGSDESAALADTSMIEDHDSLTTVVDGTTYGPLKVLCEAATLRHYPDALMIRPTYIIGPDDYTDRFTKYVHLIRAGGVVDVPEPRTAPWQYIDVRDLATFTLDAIDAGLSGPFHVAAPAGGTTYESMLNAIVAETGEGAAALNWISVEDAAARDTVFPFWAGGRDLGMLRLTAARATAVGLKSRPLVESIRSV